MKFAPLLDLKTVFFFPFFCFFFALLNARTSVMGVQSHESLLKITNLCLDMAEDGNAFTKIDAEGLSSARPQDTAASERPRNEGEGGVALLILLCDFASFSDSRHPNNNIEDPNESIPKCRSDAA